MNAVPVQHNPARRGRILVPLLCALGALSACTGNARQIISVDPRPLGRDVPVYQPLRSNAGRPQSPAFPHPTDTLTLRDAVALALLHNPELAAFAWETRARDARIVQAGLLPNPVLGVIAEDLGASRLSSGTGSQPVVQPQSTLQLSQLIELGGKRTAREGFAARTRDLAAWDYEAARIDVLTRVTYAFIDVLVAQQIFALSQQTAKLVQEVQQSVGARVVAGVVSPIEETKANVALASAQVESVRASRLLGASRARLAAQWGRPDAAFRWAAGDLAVMPALPPISALRIHLIRNPVLARWAVEISQRQAALGVERSKRIPDVTLTAGHRRFTELHINAWVIGASLPLPLFDRNQGGTEEAISRLNKAYEERRAAESRVSSALSDAYAALSIAHQEALALRETVLPGARQTFAAVSEGYQLGKFGYLDVLDAQRTLIAADGQYLRAVSDYHKAVADIERLVGAPLDEISSLPAPARN